MPKYEWSVDSAVWQAVNGDKDDYRTEDARQWLEDQIKNSDSYARPANIALKLLKAISE